MQKDCSFAGFLVSSEREEFAVTVPSQSVVTMESLTTVAAASVDASSLLAYPSSYSEYYPEECSRQWDTSMAFANSLSYALENSLKIWQVSCYTLFVFISKQSILSKTQPASYGPGSRPSGRANTDHRIPDSRLGAALDFSWSLDLAKENCRGKQGKVFIIILVCFVLCREPNFN